MATMVYLAGTFLFLGGGILLTAIAFFPVYKYFGGKKSFFKYLADL